MAAELPRPGVEVVQEFRSSNPTIIRPTLVPLVVGVAKEIVEVTTPDGLLNAAAKQGSYEQLPRIISQTSFPSPRQNIDEVDVQEETIKAFFQFGGQLREFEHSPGESFLAAMNKAMRPAIRSKQFDTATGLSLDTLILVLAVDVTARLNVTKDVVVTFAALDGANMTAEQIAEQINNAVGREVAEEIVDGTNSRVQIVSRLYGAAASITVRPGGSANDPLGFDDAAVEYRVEGPGFRAQDQSNNTTLSSWIEWSPGAYLEDGERQNEVPTAGVDAVFGFVDSDGEFWPSYQSGDLTYTGSGSIDLKVGDEFYADGSKPNGSMVMKVEVGRFKIGTVNLKLSVYDEDGKLSSAVYDESKVNTLYASAPFAPRYGWFMAKNLKTNSPAVAAVLTGTTIGNDAETATIAAPNVATYPLAAAGLTLEVVVTVDDEEQDSQMLTLTGGPYADLAALVTALNDLDPDGFFFHPAEDEPTKLAVSTDITGAGQALSILSTSTGLAALGFVAATAYTATGKDVEFLNVSATLVGGAQDFPFTAAPGETLLIERSSDGGTTWAAGTRTFTWPGAGPYANMAAMLVILQNPANWSGGVPGELTITAVANSLRITTVAKGADVGIRVGASSNGIGGSANDDTKLQFTSEVSDTGEAGLANQTLKFRLNDRGKVYSALFTSNSINEAVVAVNEAVGWPVASIDDDGRSLMLTSTLKGAASKVEAVSDSTSSKALAALGFGGGNNSAQGIGRPNPDFSIDVSGNVVLGADALRSPLTGEPFAPGEADIYIQYHGIRKDVSPVAKNPGMLRVSDIATLQTLLSPIRSDNPLGLGMFFELINAPGLECAGLGVDEISSGSPYGTLVAFARASNLIEAEEIYAIAPLTNDELVHQLFKTHVEFMASPEQKGERIVIVCPPMPEREVDNVIASGLSGGTTATENEFVVDSNPNPGLISLGLAPLELSYDDQVFIEMTVSGELRRYSVMAVNGTLVSLRVSFEDGENEDGFLSTTPLNETVLNGDWSMKVRGFSLVIPGSNLLDKAKIADTVQAKASAYNQRRFIYVFPDKVKASIGGTEELLPGFFACAAIAGMVAKFPPQQGFTNMPMTGFTGVVGSNDTFSVKQLNIMAGGGAYILVQEAPGAPLVSRHQLTTQLTSIETRELSITKVVDYVAKFMRIGLRRFIGTYNITQPFLDTLSTVIHGMLGFLTENGIILGGALNNLIQDKKSPDTVLVDITLDIPFPCNYIRLTLVI